MAQIATLPTFTPRVNYAIRVASGNYNLSTVCSLLLTNATILNDVTAGGTDSTILDADIQTAVAAVWNLLAGV